MTDNLLAQILFDELPDWQSEDLPCHSFLQEKGKQLFDLAFFPNTHSSLATSIARELCRKCPVRGDCLRMSLKQGANSSDYGVWGGTTPQDRIRLRQGRTSLLEIDLEHDREVEKARRFREKTKDWRMKPGSRVLDDKSIGKIRELYFRGVGVIALAELYGVGKNTVFRIVRQAMEAEVE